MNPNIAQVVMRMAARRRGRAMPIVQHFEIVPDQGAAFGIAPIRVVAEERTQAVAFGVFDREPMLVREALPLGRSTEFLEAFSDALDEYLTVALDEGTPRIYVPHRQALEQLSLFAERYERNSEASPKIRRLGYLCRMLYELSMIPGQQVVLCLAEILARHVVGGSLPIRDRQLRYMMVWLRPPAGVDVLDAAERAALRPAAAMLTAEDDKRIEHLRHEYKRTRDEATRREIETILDSNALAEWQIMAEARNEFWSLAITPNANLLAGYRANVKWLRDHLPLEYAAPSRTIAMSRLLDEHEIAMFDHRAALLDGDEFHFERERSKGKAFRARVVSVDRLGVGRAVKPVHMRVEIDQEIVRLRAGTGVRFRGSTMTGSVLEISRRGRGTYSVLLDIDNRAGDASRLATDAIVEILDGRRFDGRYIRKRVYDQASTFRSPLIFGDVLQQGVGVVDPALDLTAVLTRL